MAPKTTKKIGNYKIPHGTGEPCAVVDLLHSVFGKRLGNFLLWERTCFPMSDKDAWRQAKQLVWRAGKRLPEKFKRISQGKQS